MSTSPTSAALTLSEEEIKVIGHALRAYRLELYDMSYDEEDDAEFLVAGQLLNQLGVDDADALAALDEAIPSADELADLADLTDMDGDVIPAPGEEDEG